MKLYWFISSSGHIEFQMSESQVDRAHHQWACDLDVAEIVEELRPALTAIDPKTLADELKGYCAWDEKELSNHEYNLHRLVWLAAADIQEGNDYHNTRTLRRCCNEKV